MNYLIKDLSRLTGLSPARIRKWQERYDVLRPSIGTNGYYYYHNDDLMLLKYLCRQVENGHSISEAVAPGRSTLLKECLNQWPTEPTLHAIASGDYGSLGLEAFWDLKERKVGQVRDLLQLLRPLLVSVGLAWENGTLSVAEEHAFSRWLSARLQLLLSTLNGNGRPRRVLCTVFPGDQHELPALCFSLSLASRGIPLTFAGELDEIETRRELTRNPSYERLYVTATMPRPHQQFLHFQERLLQALPSIKVRLGGQGLLGVTAR